MSTKKFDEVFVSDSVYSFTRGNIFVVNRSQGTAQTGLVFKFSKGQYADGTVLTNIEDETEQYTVANGQVTFDMPDGYPKVFLAT